MRNGEFLNTHSPEDNSELVETLIPSKQVVLVAGLPGEGKTFFSLAAAYHIAYGANFLERKTKQGSVLIIDSENPKDVLVKRIQKIKKVLEDGGHNSHAEIDIQHYPSFLLDNKNTWRGVGRVIEEIKPAFITIDHLRSFHIQDENCSRGMERVARGILDLASICDSTILVLHHFNKKTGSFFSRLRGSSVLYARSEVAYEIRALSYRNGKLESFGIIPQARKGETPTPMRVVLEENATSIRLKYRGEYQPTDDPVLDLLAHRVCHIFLGDREEQTVFDIKKLLAGMGSDSEIREALRLIERKGVVKVGRHGKSHKYIYVPCDVTACLWCGRVFS